MSFYTMHASLGDGLTAAQRVVHSKKMRQERDVMWIITDTGYLYCVECANEIEVYGREIQKGDCSFGSDNCDRCAKHVGETASGEIAS